MRKALQELTEQKQGCVFTLWSRNSSSHCWSNAYQKDWNCLIVAVTQKCCLCKDTRQDSKTKDATNLAGSRHIKTNVPPHLRRPCLTNITRMLAIVVTVQWVGIIAASHNWGVVDRQHYRGCHAWKDFCTFHKKMFRFTGKASIRLIRATEHGLKWPHETYLFDCVNAPMSVRLREKDTAYY